MYVTPVENCIIDFGDGNKQILEGTNTPTLVEHTYDIEDEYIIKIMGNHYTFQASKNIIEIIQLSYTVLSYYNIFYDCSNLINISDFFKMYNTVKDCIDCLKPQGRLCIITFHSLEDRAVKNAMLDAKGKCTCPSDLPYCVCGAKTFGNIITKKPIVASKEEQEENSRSKSAKLRVFERI